jgi:hypothetical protein
MSKAKFCLVYYYVPEDKDDPELPNAFGVNLSIEEVKISDIRRLFPLEGDYIFRFKSKIGSSNVWLDVKEDAKIPLFNGRIVTKATRTSWESRGDRPTYSAPTSNATQNQAYNDVSPKQPPAQQQQQQNNYNFGAEDLNLLGTSNVGTTSAPVGGNMNQSGFNKKPVPQHDHHDLLDFGHSHSSTPPTTNQNKKNDLLSFDNLF